MAATRSPQPARPLFQWRKANGILTRLKKSGDGRPPRRIFDYVFNPADWTFLPENERTIDGILGQDISQLQCQVCRDIGASCDGQACITEFKTKIAPRGERLVEIRDAGALGRGVFAARHIAADTILGEYLGQLTAPGGGPDDLYYTFQLDGTGDCSAARVGNWTRFVNHHCERPNIRTQQTMYGRRRCVLYSAYHDIAAGQQLFVDYGAEYFGDHLSCTCDADEKPHMPGPRHRASRYAASTTSSEDIGGREGASSCAALAHGQNAGQDWDWRGDEERVDRHPGRGEGDSACSVRACQDDAVVASPGGGVSDEATRLASSVDAIQETARVLGRTSCGWAKKKAVQRARSRVAWKPTGITKRYQAVCGGR